MKTPMQEHIEWLKKEYKKLESMGELGIALHIGDCIQNAESLLEKEKEVNMNICLKNFPSDDEVEEAAKKEAERIFTDTDNGSEWYARHHGFMDGVDWVKNYLAEKPNTKER